MIRGSTNINWVWEKRVSGRIDAVYEKPSTFEVGQAKYTSYFCTIMNPPMIALMYKKEEIIIFYSGFEP